MIDDVQNVQTRPESIGPLDGVTQGEIGTARKIGRKEKVSEVQSDVHLRYTKSEQGRKMIGRSPIRRSTSLQSLAEVIFRTT